MFETIKENYNEIFRENIEELITVQIDQWADYISASFDMNWARWPDSKNDYGFPEGMVEKGIGVKKSADFLKNWLSRRMNYLDSLWVERQGY